MIYSSRGADFRTCFGKIGGLRALTDAPLIAVTATAPKAIQANICDSLGLKEPAVIIIANFGQTKHIFVM